MRGRGGNFNRGGSNRGGARGGRGGGSRPSRADFDGPPSSVIPVGKFLHACKDEMVYKCTLSQQVPYFNTPLYTKDINKLGMLDEVFGPINDIMFAKKTT